MRLIVFRATSLKLTRAPVVISPASTTRLSLTSVSAATREVLSCFRIASSTASEIWSATLSGWPSDTDSEVKRKSLIADGLLEKAARIPNLHCIPTIVLRLLSGLPLKSLHWLGTVLGWIMYGTSPTYRRHLRENLATARYHDARLRRRAIAAAGQLVMELPTIWFRAHDKVVALVQSVEGADTAFAAQRAGKALLFLTPHMGAFEISAQYAAMQVPITVLYRPPKAAWLEPLMREGRGRANVRLVPADLGGVREIFRALKRAEAVGVLPDQAS